MLHLADMTEQDSGNYLCYAENNVDFPTVKSVLINVNHAPKITSFVKEQCEYGSTTECLTCQSKGKI